MTDRAIVTDDGPASGGGRSRPLVAIVGAGVTGSRTAETLADSGACHVELVDRRDDLPAADVVVLAHPAPHAGSARDLLYRGVSVISMSDEVDDVGQLLALGPLADAQDCSLVVGAAMAPGLSGLLARQLANQLDGVDEIHVAMHGTGGPACARQHHRALGGTSIGLHDGEWIRRPAGAGRELCWFPEPVNAYDCYRAEMADPILLHRVFPAVSRMSARMSATRRDRFTARLPMLRPPHSEGGIGAVRVEVRGSLPDGSRETLIAGTAVRSGVAAAAVAAAVTGWAMTPERLRGLVILGDERLPTADLLEVVRSSGVVLSEFTGVSRADDSG